MIIKEAKDSFSSGTGCFVALVAFFWLLFSLGLYDQSEGNPISLVISAVCGLPFALIFSIKHAKRKKRLNQENEAAKSPFPIFVCKECFTPIQNSVECENITGLPILYYCKKCDILWFTGSTKD